MKSSFDMNALFAETMMSSMNSTIPAYIIVVIILLALCLARLGLEYKTDSERNRYWLKKCYSIKERIKAWQFLIHGRDIIQKEYLRANDKPFEVHGPDNRYVFFTDSKDIEEMTRVSESCLTLEAAASQMLQPKYTFHGYDFSALDPTKRSEGTGVFVRVLKGVLQNKLPILMPQLQVVLSNRFDELYRSMPESSGMQQAKMYPIMMDLTIYANSLAMFGPELASNSEFRKASRDFIEDTMKIAETIRLAPSIVAPYLGRLGSFFLSSHEKMKDALWPVVEKRLENVQRKRRGLAFENHRDCIQWIIEAMPHQKPWGPLRVIHELLAIWFGSVHGISTTVTFALQDLCLHPEYKEPLSEELHSESFDEFRRSGQGLPLLDSFIKESARHTPLEAMSTRRRALKRIDLSHGITLNKGDWACTPCHAIMQDARHFPNPASFQGFRFVDQIRSHMQPPDSSIPEKKSSASEFADVNSSWQMWGNGRTCPGRYFASAVIKIILSHTIRDYDFELNDTTAARWFSWSSSMIPTTNAELRLHRRLNHDHRDQE